MGVLETSILVGAAALTIWIVQHNVRGRKRERERGPQTASEFALLYEAPTERFVAEKIHPYLQMSTFTRQVRLQKDDLLWESPLNFVQDDVEDNLRIGFWDELSLGLSAERVDFAPPIFAGVRTVGDLVSAIAAIYEAKYGVMESTLK